MAELIVRDVDPEVVSKLTERAESHHRSIEEEHYAILRATLLSGDNKATKTTPQTFEQYLSQMPDVGEDADFARINGSIREADLAD